MGSEEDAAAVAGSGAGRKAYWRSASWSAPRATSEPEAGGDTPAAMALEKNSVNGMQRRSPVPPLTPRSSQNCKARSSLPPLQPLSIARRSYDEWPKAGSDDVGEWPQPPTPGGRVYGPNKAAGEGLKLDLSSIRNGVKKDQIAYFDKECSKVADHIYLGGDSVARNREVLRQNGITHVLNCVGFVCPEYFKSDLVYKTLWLQDSPTEDITSILYDVFDYFEDVREHRGRVFVHCCHGVSRSTSLVIAYLMWREGQSFDDAFQLVKTARGIANPNMGFACQLLQCQKRVHAIPLSPNSVLRMYRMAPHSSYDPLHLVPKMLNEPSPAALDSRGAFIVLVPSSIYIWIGKECHPVMEKDARAAAFQVVRYEKVRGPVVTVADGLEPAEFWEVFSSAPVSAESHAKVGKDQATSAIKNGAVKRLVESYNVDFEVFYKAISGGVVPLFSSPGTGQETRLPARESSWSILRWKFISGTVSKVYPDPLMVKDVDGHANRVQLLSMESSASPPFHSPSSFSSDSSSSSKGNSESPSCSPSTTSSPSLTPSPASSSFHDYMFPPPRAPFSVTTTSEPSKSCTEDAPSPHKGVSCSIAERRASFSPLKLPVLTKDASLPLRGPANPLVHCSERSTDIKYLTEDSCLEMTSCTGQDSVSNDIGSCGLTFFNNGIEGSSTFSHGNGLLRPISVGQIDGNSEISHAFQPLVYRWPTMETVTTFCKEDVDSSAMLLLLTSSLVRSRHLDRKLFLWIGSCFEQNNRESQLDCDAEVVGAKEREWTRVGSDFLSFMGLPKDIPFEVVKGEDTDEFFRLISSSG